MTRVSRVRHKYVCLQVWSEQVNIHARSEIFHFVQDDNGEMVREPGVWGDVQTGRSHRAAPTDCLYLRRLYGLEPQTVIIFRVLSVSAVNVTTNNLAPLASLRLG